MKKHEILVPIFTPFKDNGEVDYAALEKLVKSVLERGADGLYTGGSSAEFVLLSHEERKKTLEVAAKAGDGCPIIAHIGCPGTDEAIDLGKHAAKISSVISLASVPPFYYSYPLPLIKKYYTDIADATGKQILIYSLATLGSLPLDFFVDMLADERIWGLKYTQFNYYTLNRIKAASDKFVYSGCDEAFLYALSAGADGAIGTSMNFMPQMFNQVMDLFRAGDMAGAQAVQNRMNNIIQVCVDTATLPAMKYAAKLLGVDVGGARRPFAPLTEAQKQLIEKTVKENL